MLNLKPRIQLCDACEGNSGNSILQWLLGLVGMINGQEEQFESSLSPGTSLAAFCRGIILCKECALELQKMIEEFVNNHKKADVCFYCKK